jgi:type IV pilus assembly protein PilQ
MERVRKLIEVLDTQTPQILIEGKVIEAAETFVNDIGGSIGIADIANGAYSVAFSGANAIDPLLGGGSPVINNTNVVTNSQNGASIGWSLVRSSPRINLLLNIGETENKSRVVSSPKLVVQNKQSANVVQSTPVIVPSTGIGPNGGIVTTSTVQQANLSLDVTPTVTSDGSVLMKLTLERDIPFEASGSTQQNAVANRSIKTNVLVDSGNTLVMGGFYTATNQDASTGIPFLKDIPIVGWLFGSSNHEVDRDELFFFITPQVLNPKKTGNAG